MKSTDVRYSMIQYRPNPVDVEKRVVNLGVALEFLTDQYWVIALAIRAGLNETELLGVDELSRRVLERRSDVIYRELDLVLPKAKEFGDALNLLSSLNPWSMFVSPPRKIRLTLTKNEMDRKTTEKLAESFVFKLLIKAHKEEQATVSNVGRAERSQRSSRSEEGLQAWMFSPKTIMQPRTRRSTAHSS